MTNFTPYHIPLNSVDVQRVRTGAERKSVNYVSQLEIQNLH